MTSIAIGPLLLGSIYKAAAGAIASILVGLNGFNSIGLRAVVEMCGADRVVFRREAERGARAHRGNESDKRENVSRTLVGHFDPGLSTTKYMCAIRMISEGMC